MGYKIKFDNGHVVEFDSQPTDADIDEAYAHTQTISPKTSMLEQAAGVGEGLLNIATGTVGGVLGIVPTAMQALNQASQGKGLAAKEFETQLAENMAAMTYEPRTELGQDIAHITGKAMSDVIIPAAAAIQGLPYVNTLSPILGAVGRNLAAAKAPKARAIVETVQEGRLAELKAAREKAVQEQAAQKAETQKAQEFLGAEQVPLFEPSTEMHRAYTDMRAATEDGGERAFSRPEFEQMLKNLAEEESLTAERKGTGFRMPPPEEMDAAYASYLQHLDERQGTFFDVNSRQEKWQGGPVPEERKFYPTEREGHPFFENPEQVKDTIEHEQRQKVDAERSLEAGAGEERPTYKADEFLKEHTRVELEQQRPSSPYARAAQEAVYNEQHPLRQHPLYGNKLAEIAHTGIESPEHALELSKQAKDLDQNAIQRGLNYVTKGQWIKGRVNHPAVHFAVDVMNDNANYGHALVADRVHNLFDKSIRELKGKERVEVAELLSTADLIEQPITDEMMASWNLSPEAQTFIKVVQENMDIAFEETNRALRAVGSKEIAKRDGYIPMNMKGNYRKVAYKYARDDAGNLVMDVEGNPKPTVVGAIGSDFKTLPSDKLGWSLERIEQHMLDKDPELMFSDMVDLSAGRTVHGSAEGAFLEILKRLAGQNKMYAEFLETLKTVAADDPKSYMGMMKHTKAKKGVWGMEGRKPWLSAEENAESLFSNMREYQERSMKWGFLAEGAADVNAVIRDEFVATEHKNAAQLAERIVQQHLGLTATKMSKALDTVFAGAFLGNRAAAQTTFSTMRSASNKLLFGGINLPFLLSQIVQPVIEAPAMAMYLKQKGMSQDALGFSSMAKSTYVLAKLTEPGSKHLAELLPYQKEALEYAKKNAVYPEDLVEHNQRLQKDAQYYLNTISDFLPKKADTVTRMHSFFTYVEMLHEAGLKPEEGLFKQAHELTNKTMNDYSRANRPAIYNELGMLGDSLYNLQSYPHNQISKLAFFVDHLIKERSVAAAAPFVTQLMATIVGGGLLGLPFYLLWSAAYSQISELMGEPRDLTLDIMNASSDFFGALGKDAQYMGSHGIFAAVGVDMSQRLSGPSFGTHSLVDTLAPGLSKIGSAAYATGRAIVNPNEENIESAAYTAAPSGIQGLLDTILFQKDDMAISKNPERFKVMAERTPADVNARRLGFTGIQEAVQKTEVYQQDVLDKRFETARLKAINSMKQDLWRNRDMSDSIDDFFTKGQGDLQKLDRMLSDMVVAQKINPVDAVLIKRAASNSITSTQSLIRRTQ